MMIKRFVDHVLIFFYRRFGYSAIIIGLAFHQFLEGLKTETFNGCVQSFAENQ